MQKPPEASSWSSSTSIRRSSSKSGTSPASFRPVVLDQVGLSAGLETLVQDFNKREKTLCGLHMDLPDLNEDAMRTDVFRIVQEGLTNIARHAEATFAYVRLRCPEGLLQLELGDNGKACRSR